MNDLNFFQKIVYYMTLPWVLIFKKEEQKVDRKKEERELVEKRLKLINYDFVAFKDEVAYLYFNGDKHNPFLLSFEAILDDKTWEMYLGLIRNERLTILSN